MQTKRRQRLGAEAWRALLGRFSASGLTVAAFCQRESVSAACFYRWRAQLGTLPVDAERSALVPTVVSSGKAAFVDLGALGADASSSRLELRLDLGGGLMLQLRRG